MSAVTLKAFHAGFEVKRSTLHRLFPLLSGPVCHPEQNHQQNTEEGEAGQEGEGPEGPK